MARSILGFTWILAAAWILGYAPLALAADAAPGCSVKQPGEIATKAGAEAATFEHQVREGPFYLALQREFGQPLSCTMEFDGGAIGINYVFRRRAKLTARIDHQIESSELKLQVARMDPGKALSLLKAAERDAYRPNGCGITWDHPERPAGGASGTAELIYRGDTCNCQARVSSRNHYAVSLLLRSAC